ncbi:MAG: 3-isopropylmalate dehydratase large subunit [Rhodospirillales bacterium]|nr:3-isopropylmalate dehydratase [Rhodospirillaceae bacterium]MDP6429177.1 3-isopropylmalate dehydratase large subunit [Rhodospirillales bacterium]MDP6646534.1 3-isopropylmalate dehydratase large subunit [Rhodospirillales bacterium]MDP6842198.1 3-isopropylmalate dehydratase large subunit [Rhodospirillales bacterium]
MQQTIAEKIIAKAAGKERVRPGDIVTCVVDLAMIHDSGGPRRAKPILERLGVGVWDASKIVLVSDHYAPCVDAESAAILKLTREWAAEQGIMNFYDQHGICHVVTPERGHLGPGMFAVGGDSHSPTGGAFGAYMFGIGATDMAGVLATGETWIKVPHTIRINWSGAFGAGVAAKDMALRMCAVLGMDGGDYQAIQYGGDTVAGLDMMERMTLSNMAAELGAQTGIIEPDETTAAYVTAAGGDAGDWAAYLGDADADYRRVHEFSADDLEPQVAAPHSPANAADVGDADKADIDQFYIGACTGAKLNDLKMAASVLKGNKVAPGKRLTVAPASARILADAARDGTMEILLHAGANLLPTGCGACAGYGVGTLAEDEVCLASTARNFQGRMGANSSRVYLASPYTVAASAVKGVITDPREMLGDGS